ncbi:LAMI_0C08438g1_1 [Lachancea mirantina]|uniref:Regulator of rDNA transcription 14 n=1 Tax=Lachancea mirantina TaxID=1230905 RepID=A0A1G4J4H5_9SACH|nr:LAMI_0C08438g1_1 [Lachancea mirantina]
MNTELSRQQATNAVNSLLSKMLPGSAKIDHNRKKRPNRAGAPGARLINQNLKKRVELQERDVERIKRGEARAKKRAVMAQKAREDERTQLAKLEVLRQHQKDDTLTKKERKYLNSIIARNTAQLQTWDVSNPDLQDLQDAILGDRNQLSKQGRKRRVGFVEQKQGHGDHHFAGLTPGLAPVGLSDEESSDEE